jgi:GT2 family glycosyltransferase
MVPVIDEKKIAIVLVDYNGVLDTIECINSVMQSSISIQIVVVDNSSKENDANIIKSQFSNVKVFRSEKNLGFAGANNIGIKWALENDFKYIGLLNNDTVVQKNTFKILLEYANKKTVVAPFMYYESAPKDLWFGGGRLNKFKGNPVHLKKERNVPFYCTFITGCCFVAHRDIWESCGLLDESYFMYHEDTDYSIRLLQGGYKIEIVPESKIYHKVGKSSGGKESAFSIYYNTRNRFLVLKKYKSFFYATAFPFTFFSRIVRMLLLMTQNRKEWRAFFQGIKDSKKGITGQTWGVKSSGQNS